MENNENRVTCVIFDWAGTTVDYGCFAPLGAFTRVFEEAGLPLSIEEARGPMGLPKRDHVRELLKLPRVSALFAEKYGRAWNEADVDRLYEGFVPALMGTLKDYCEPLPGVIETVAELRGAGLKIGSTTGYTKEMMDIVAPGAAARGYAPDALVTPDEAGAGRPAPYMIFRNMERLGVYPPSNVVKAGDTLADVREGKNAGVWSAGIIEGSSELGLTREECEALSENERAERYAAVRGRFLAAGADFVIERVTELPKLIEQINEIKLGQETK
ncbi:phosphonoacetaldehyde hydrolase [Cloacibacillus sp. An23]|uniref:phosphonoacetaldehyde hydrolase n=1 Tax=Cloacibacillus sp. An23 TaxID=1965591 RepID=UPI000B3AB138|nr:phosphonoacetaldehyde hydrolase [Cloacibacillus sp. An23]OUO93367.1 phosphonoacetaldehyde hydrolase [Cloacibacillus sp. An23]